MKNDSLIPLVDLETDAGLERSNPMIWEGEEAAEGVFLGADPAAEDPLALLGTPPLQLPRQPRLPEDFTPAPALETWLGELQLALARAVDNPCGAIALPLDGLDEVSRQAVTEILGEGEVDGSVTLDGVHYEVQESVLAGIWRIRGSDGSDCVEVAEAPTVVQRAAASLEIAEFSVPEPGGAVMNAPAVLWEIRERARRWQDDEDEPNHVLNFTLLPMNEADHEVLTSVLGRAELQMNSGGFGDCRIMATRYRHVWAVQFVNAMGHTILDTIEIGALPPAARAAWQDFEDSSQRLAELLEAYLV